MAGVRTRDRTVQVRATALLEQRDVENSGDQSRGGCMEVQCLRKHYLPTSILLMRKSEAEVIIFKTNDSEWSVI